MSEEINDVTAKSKTVFVKIVFLKLSDIDTVKEQFAADIFIQARWRERSLDHGKEKDKPELGKYWEPKLNVQNVVSSSKNEKWKDLRFGKSGEAYIVEKRRIKGIFAENLELQQFPFDFQDLGVVITSERPETEVDIVEDDQDLSTLTVSCFVDEQEWEMRDYVESEKKSIAKEFSEGQNVVYPFLLLKTLARRRAAFFVWNIIIIMTLISSLSFATFAVSRILPQNRLQLAFTLTLTGVTFRFVTNQQLPKIPYLTQLDKYILFCMVFNYLVAVWHAVVTRITDADTQVDADFGAFIFFIALYTVFHLIFIISTIVMYIRKRDEVRRKEQEYSVKAQKLLGDTWKSKRRSKRAVGPVALPF